MSRDAKADTRGLSREKRDAEDRFSEDDECFADKHTAAALVAAMQACPFAELDFDFEGIRMPVRKLEC